MPQYLLPDVGEGLTEAEIVSWKVKVGDTIAINDIVVEIETAKSLVELPSPYAGEVTALLVAEGEMIPVGTPIIAIGADAPAPSEPAADLGEIDLSNPAATGGGEGESLVGRVKADRAPLRRPRRGSASPATESAAATQMQVQGAFSPGGAQSDAVVESDEASVPAQAVVATAGEVRALAKPPVRKLAKDLGVDLGSVPGSGPAGVVTRADVEAAASGPAAPVRVAAPTGSEWTEPVKGVRKMMASAMVGSAFSAPHVTEWITVDVTESMKLAERLGVSPLLLLARAVCVSIKRTPEINSTWGDDVITFRSYVNLGIAAATPRGLVVPNIKGAESMSLAELKEALGELVATARAGKTQPADMAGGTFTITNVGVFGVDAGTPIINPGESAILCFGAVAKRPWVVEGAAGDEIAIRQVTTLALSFDHRHIDGEKGSRFLADVATLMRDPGMALAF